MRETSIFSSKFTTEGILAARGSELNFLEKDGFTLSHTHSVISKHYEQISPL